MNLCKLSSALLLTAMAVCVCAETHLQDKAETTISQHTEGKRHSVVLERISRCIKHMRYEERHRQQHVEEAVQQRKQHINESDTDDEKKEAKAKVTNIHGHEVVTMAQANDHLMETTTIALPDIVNRFVFQLEPKCQEGYKYIRNKCRKIV